MVDGVLISLPDFLYGVSTKHPTSVSVDLSWQRKAILLSRLDLFYFLHGQMQYLRMEASNNSVTWFTDLSLYQANAGAYQLPNFCLVFPTSLSYFIPHLTGIFGFFLSWKHSFSKSGPPNLYLYLDYRNIFLTCVLASTLALLVYCKYSIQNILLK